MKEFIVHLHFSCPPKVVVPDERVSIVAEGRYVSTIFFDTNGVFISA
jgi:hypothetical protein